MCVGFQWVFQMIKREEFRGRFNLEGSTAGDCCGAYCCGCCSLIQEEKEALLRTGGDNASGVQQPQQGYQRPEAMGGYIPPKQ